VYISSIIDYNSPDHTSHEYISMYTDNPNIRIINLRYFRKDGRSHFVIVTKLITIMSNKKDKTGELRQYYICDRYVKKVRYEQHDSHIKEYHTAKKKI